MKLVRLLALGACALFLSLSSTSSAHAVLCYVDADGDGFGDVNDPGFDPGGPCVAGTVDNNLDCDDTNPSVNPTAAEVCDGVDNNCDGTIDEAGGTTWYLDADGDGFGNPGMSVVACSAPPGYVGNGLDCDDAIASVHPGATEVCNGLDDDCNGTADDGAGTTWYADADGDGFGNPGMSVVACSEPAGYVGNGIDCDDGDASVYPGASEVCNGLDDDCNGAIDDGVGPTWYADADADGFGDISSAVVACSAPPGYVGNSIDCDDGNSGVYPGATEVCNSIDDNCDGVIDEGCAACPVTLTGDVNLSGTLTSADIIFLVNYVFKSGVTPQPCEAAGDVNCSGTLTSADIIYLVNFVFKSGAAPCDVCTLIPGTWPCP